MKELKKCVTEVYARITGYFSPVKRWNPGKKSEKKDRKEYSVFDREYPPIEKDGFK